MCLRYVKYLGRVCVAGGFVVAVLSGCSSRGGRSTADRRYHYKYGPGTALMLADGTAVAPRNAPRVVHELVAAGNRIQGKPYVYGGGHAVIEDTGYDCSGTVSYVLLHAGLLESPLPSSAFRKYGKSGPGKWITIYARDGHVFVVVAGLRLDTGGTRNRTGPRWKKRSRSIEKYKPRHPPGL